MKTMFRFAVFSMIFVTMLAAAVIQPQQRPAQAQSDELTAFQARQEDIVAASGVSNLARLYGNTGLEEPYFNVKEILGRDDTAALEAARASRGTSQPQASAGLAASAESTALRRASVFAFWGYDLKYAVPRAGYYYTPPDTMGAVGPTQFVITQNGLYRVFDKKTGVAITGLEVSAEAFWPDSVDPTDDAGGDPRVRFDRLTDRWVVSAFTRNAPAYQDNRIVFAISDGPVIKASTVWTYYYIDPVGSDDQCFIDYPTLGVDVNAIMFGANMFDCTGSGYPSDFNVTAWVMPKSLLPAGGGNVTGIITSFTDLFWGAGVYTPMPADNYDPTATQSYFIGQNGFVDNELVMLVISNPGTSPALGGAYVSINDKNDGWPEGAPYPGNPAPAAGGCPGACDWGLDTLGFKPIGGAMVRHGRIWLTISSSVDGPGGTLELWPATGDRNSVIVLEVDIASATTVQDFNIYDQTTPLGGTPKHYFQGSVMVSGQGHALAGFTATDTDFLPPSAAFAYRLRTDPLNTISPAVVYWKGTNTGDIRQAFETSDRQTRWGDYSMTTLDPCDDQTFYTIQEYQAPGILKYGGNWGVAIARIKAPPPPAQLAFSEPQVSAGEASTLAEIVGDPDDVAAAKEFYNTSRWSMSPSCRQKLKAGVVGGTFAGTLKVNGIANSDIDQVDVDLDTSGVTGQGVAVLEICNPDGQCMQAAVQVVNAGGQAGAVTVSDPGISKVGVLQPGGLGLVGEQITWNITVTNVSGVTATNVVVTDPNPSELRVDSANTSKGSYTINGNTVTFNIGDMAPGDIVTMQVVTTVLQSPASGVVADTSTVIGIGDSARSATGTVNLVTGLPSTGYPPSGE